MQSGGGEQSEGTAETDPRDPPKAMSETDPRDPAAALADEMALLKKRMAELEAAPAPTKKAHGVHMALFLAANAEGTSRKKRWALMLVSIFIILGQCTVLDVIVQESSHPRCMQHLQRVGLH